MAFIYLFIDFSADVYQTHAQGDDGKVGDVTAVRALTEDSRGGA